MRISNLVAVLLSLILGGLVFLLKPSQFAAILPAAVLALVVMRRPLLGLMLFIMLATTIPYTTVNIGIRTTISEGVLMLTWVGIFFQYFIGRLKRTGVWLATEQSMLWLMLYSLIPLVVGALMVTAPEGPLSNWIRWLLNLSVLFIVPILLQDERKREWAIDVFLLGNLLMLLLSVFYFLKDRDANTFIPVLELLRYAHPEAVKDIFSANYQRMASPWVHPNLTGGILALSIPVAMLYALTRKSWRRALGVSVVVLGCAGLFFSISRGAIVALALVLLWMAYNRVPYSGRLISYGAVFAMALVMFYPPLQERMLTIFDASNASTEVRIEEYRMFSQAMSTYPLGIGFKVDPPVPGSGLLGISNLWLNVIYKIGLPGLFFFVIVTWRWWQAVRPRQKITKINHQNALWLGCTSGVLAALFTGIFDHYYSFTFVLIALFWLLAAIAIQQARPLQPMPEENKIKGSKQ